MKTSTIDRILDGYGLEYIHIAEPQKGYRNESYQITIKDQTSINLILYKSESDILHRITNGDRIADILHEKGLPVRHRICPKIILLKSGNYKKIWRDL